MSSTDKAITVSSLGKRYQIGTQSPWRRLGLGRAGTARDFWALRDVSFELQKGEVLGVVGRNGAGKSTLLKLLSRIISPTEGTAVIHGRVASLLEVGTGFHPELTGRENVLLNGAILGMRRSEVVKKFDEIVAFAEVDQFIDTPVKRYSSGMYTRLAFAVAAHLEPEVLIVDEVLAVGDANFQKKCLGRMNEVAKQGRTVLFVSHTMSAVAQLTTRCVYLKSGMLEYVGPTANALERYVNTRGSTVDPDVSATPRMSPHHGTKLRIVRLAPAAADAQVFALDAPLEFDVDVRAEVGCDDVHFSGTITDASGVGIMTAAASRPISVRQGLCRFRVAFREPRLAPGIYTLALGMLDHDLTGPRNVYDVVRPGPMFEVGPQRADGSVLFNWGATFGYIHHPLLDAEPIKLDQAQTSK